MDMSSAVAVIASPTIQEKQNGLERWMSDVLARVEEAENGFRTDAVHGLRTALRRCRSLAEGFRVFDGDSRWKKMRRAGKEVFTSLGALRDAQVMLGWIDKLADGDDPVREKLGRILLEREVQQKRSAATALQQFDRRQWGRWSQELPRRALRVPLDSPNFTLLALEKWHEAHNLHTRALQNRTNCAFHDLRIGIKRLRYTVENFLPSLHACWGDDLKELQDLLGDVHDLDVLWLTAVEGTVFSDAFARAIWRARILEEKKKRLNVYREKMIGEGSLWRIWREELPANGDVRSLGLERLATWASFADPDFAHARHVADLALRLYEQLPMKEIIDIREVDHYRDVLRVATLMHDVGRSRSSKGHHKASARLVRKLAPPLGWTGSELRLAAVIARYHRGALPSDSQKWFHALSPSRRRLVQFLAGILRLACACDRDHDGKIRRLYLQSSDPIIVLRAEGYSEATPLAEELAGARHLLEVACRRPILLMPVGRQATRAA
jgi:CHAD domain-containing protein